MRTRTLQADLRARAVALLAPVLACAACASAAAAPDAAGAPDVASAPDVVTTPDAVTAPDDPPPADAAAADAPVDDVFHVAPHEPFPQVPARGGPVLRHARLVAVTFADDPARADEEAFVQWIAGSRWLTTVGAEYGVEVAGALPAARRGERAPDAVTLTQITAMLTGAFDDGSLPTPDDPAGDTLYVVHYPAHTTITYDVHGRNALSCEEFGGVHFAGTWRGHGFAFAIIPACAAVSGLTADETREASASHEIIEALTDPFPLTNPAWALSGADGSSWIAFGAEVADLCAQPLLVAREDGHAVQRSWSNAAALAGGDPCVPVDPATPMYGVTATPGEIAEIAPGGSRTFDIAAWSSAPLDRWRVATETVGDVYPTLLLSTHSMRNGDTATLRVTVPSTAPSGAIARVLLVARRSDTDYRIWPLMIVVP